VSALLGLGGYPAIAESTMIQRDCAIAGFENARLHLQHLSARESVVAVEQAKQACVQVTCEATPHHLCITDQAVQSLDAGRFKMNPPLRSDADRLALIDALRSGTIDCVATDHAPHAREEKEQPFEVAPMGVTGLETAFAALHTHLVLPGVLSLETIVERMTSGTEPFGLRVPQISVGSRADVCLVDLAAEWEVGEAGYASRSSNNAFAGQTLTGRVRMTVADGIVAYRERSFAIGAV
jgi:dihydroorotase